MRPLWSGHSISLTVRVGHVVSILHIFCGAHTEKPLEGRLSRPENQPALDV